MRSVGYCHAMTSTGKTPRSRSRARVMYRGGPLDGTLTVKTARSVDPHYRATDGRALKTCEGDAILSGRLAPKGAVYVLVGVGAQFDGPALLRIAVYDHREAPPVPAVAPLPVPTADPVAALDEMFDSLGIDLT